VLRAARTSAGLAALVLGLQQRRIYSRLSGFSLSAPGLFPDDWKRQGFS
jgi:hypothetical protein